MNRHITELLDDATGGGPHWFLHIAADVFYRIEDLGSHWRFTRVSAAEVCDSAPHRHSIRASGQAHGAWLLLDDGPTIGVLEAVRKERQCSPTERTPSSSRSG